MSYVTNIQKHGINTRASNNLHVQRVNHEFAKHCIRFRLVQTVNTMPNLINYKHIVCMGSVHMQKNILSQTMSIAAI